MRTRILFLMDQLNLAGAQKRAINLGRSVDPDRYEVEIVCLQAGGPLEAEVERAGLPLTILSFDANPKKPGNLLAMLALIRHLRRRSPQIVQTFSYWSNIFGSLAARLARVPIVITSRTSQYDLQPQGKTAKLLERLCNPLADKAVAIAETVRRETLEFEGLDPESVAMIYNGVELDPASSTRTAEAIRSDLGLEPPHEAVVMIANFHDYKRHDTLLTAAKRVLAERPQTRFLLVGRETDYRATLVAMARELGIEHAIIWTGIRDDIPDVLSVCRVGVLCSQTEALGNAVLECMGAGLPMVVTRVGGLPEVVVDGETGFLIDIGDDAALARRLLELLGDPALATAMGQAGHDRVENVFSRETMVRAYSALYDAELARSTRAQSKR